MDVENIIYLRKGIEIAKECLYNCNRLRLELSLFKPNQKIIDMLLAKDYIKLQFNSKNPDDDILILHNSKDEYAHNGDIRITCFLSKAPEVLAHVRKHEKVLALIKELKKKGGEKNGIS